MAEDSASRIPSLCGLVKFLLGSVLVTAHDRYRLIAITLRRRPRPFPLIFSAMREAPGSTTATLSYPSGIPFDFSAFP